MARTAPILLSPSTIAVINIYEKSMDCLDIVMDDFIAYQGKDVYSIAREGAAELMRHIADDCNLIFLESLESEVRQEIFLRKHRVAQEDIPSMEVIDG
jgi:hypothetical protein